MFLKSLALSNILSFGPEPHSVELGPLNVIIGPNGSGKSNFIEAIGLLQAAPLDLASAIREGGGIRDWLWKGSRQPIAAALNAVIENQTGQNDLRYLLSFREVGQQFEIADERLEYASPDRGHVKPYLFYGLQDGQGVLNVQGVERRLRREAISLSASILSQRKDPDQYPDLTRVGSTLPKIAIYRDWSFGHHTPPRLPQKADLPNDRLLPDASNLALVLNRIRRDGDALQRMTDAISAFLKGAIDFDVQIEGGTVQLFLREGRLLMPATRLSDGTLRFLCLLAILCHPEPPPLICLEEPELGLHPDIIPTVTDLLKEASTRTQIIVTTHSDILIDVLTDRPEAVLIAEKGEDGTRLKRLDPKELSPWLDKYHLGQLWTSGELGGTRW